MLSEASFKRFTGDQPNLDEASFTSDRRGRCLIVLVGGGACPSENPAARTARAGPGESDGRNHNRRR